MTVTYSTIATTTIGSNATITFSSIPSTYTDLRLIINGGITTDYWDFAIRYNGDSGTNYSQTSLVGDGSTAGSNRTTSATKIVSVTALRNNDLNAYCIFDIMNYSNTTTFKTCLNRNGNAIYNGTAAIAGIWRSTSAINEIYIYARTSNDGVAHLFAGTTATLYGIKAE